MDILYSSENHTGNRRCGLYLLFVRCGFYDANNMGKETGSKSQIGKVKRLGSVKDQPGT